MGEDLIPDGDPLPGVTYLPWFDCAIVEERIGGRVRLTLWVATQWPDVYVPWDSPLRL